MFACVLSGLAGATIDIISPIATEVADIEPNVALVPDAANAEPVPMLTTALLLELQKPPVVASVNIVSALTQTAATPDIGAGRGLTVIMLDVLQPELSV